MDQANNHNVEHGFKNYYTVNEFGILLKQIRIYKGYKHQNTVACEMKISRQVFSLWELGRRLPTIKQLIELANFFEVDIQYFFIPGANPEEYDLLRETITDEQNIDK